jgi:hypothetical protein
MGQQTKKKKKKKKKGVISLNIKKGGATASSPRSPIK